MRAPLRCLADQLDSALYRDPSMAQCNPQLPAKGESVELFVVAFLEEQDEEISIVEFRIAHMPEQWAGPRSSCSPILLWS